MVTEFTPMSSFLGGGLIGVSVVLLMWTTGRIAGVSGIARAVLKAKKEDFFWRIAFILGLITGGGIIGRIYPENTAINLKASLFNVISAGLLVGIGTALAGGCTSGHGICGLSRLSKRSIWATFTFMIFGILTVWIMKRF